MWQLTVALLLVISLASADPQGYDYLPPSQSFKIPQVQCLEVTSVVNTQVVRSSVVPTTIQQIETQYVTTTVYSQRILPTTLYRTQTETKINYQTSIVQRPTQVVREQYVTRTQQPSPVFNTRYETSIRVVPQVSYITKEQLRTQVIPVEVTNTRFSTRFQDVVQYQTIPVQQTSIVRIPGKNVVSTIYRTQQQVSVLQRQLPAQTRIATATQVQNVVETRYIPSPPVVNTRYIQSQRIIPTTLVRTQYQTRYDTRLAYETQTQFLTQTQIVTQVVPQEVVITRDIPREVLRTELRTQVVPTTIYQTRVETQINEPLTVLRTQQAYQTSVVRLPGQDIFVTRDVVQTQVRQQVVYQTQNVQRQATITRTVTQTCGGGGYSYPEPQVAFNF